MKAASYYDVCKQARLCQKKEKTQHKSNTKLGKILELTVSKGKEASRRCWKLKNGKI
jgi:hypothetical protein